MYSVFRWKVTCIKQHNWF